MDFLTKGPPPPAESLESLLEEAMALALRCELRLRAAAPTDDLKKRVEYAILHAEHTGAMHAVARLQTHIANRTAEMLLYAN